MTPSTPIEALRRIVGLFVGQLSEDELRIFNAACRSGHAYRSFTGASGFMGLAKVELVDTALADLQEKK